MKRRIKSALAIIFLLQAIIFMGGCETLKGAAQGASEGAKKDWATLKKTDAWVRKNLW